MKAFGFRPKLYTALKNYSKELFMADLMAGIIVGIVALPLAIAFGIASGVSPEKGIITAIIAGFIISLMGGSKVQIGGPTGAFIVIIYGIIQQYGESGLIVATLMAGVLLILLGVFKLGAVIKFIPYPIIVGFTSGIAVTIFTTQIADIFGLTFGGEKVPGDFVGKWMIYFRHFDTVNWWNTIVSIVSIFIIAITPRFSKKIPGSLIAIIVVTVAVWLMKVYGGIDCIDTIGDRFSIRAELPDAVMPALDWEAIKNLFPVAITIAVLGAIESLLSATVADGVIGDKHDSNTELIAQGVANMATPLFGGIPPYPIIVGFTSGIAVTIFTTQIADIFGLTFGGEKVPGDFVGKWMIYFRHFDTVNWWNTIVSIVSIFIIAITPRFSKKIPGSLIAIIVVTVAVWLMKVYGGIDCIDTIGDRFSIRAELPDAVMPALDWEAIKNLFPVAITIAVLGAIESLLSATVADGVIGDKHDSNTELIAQGVANMATPLFGGIPATGAIARTMANINNGGKTPVAGMVHAVVLLLILLFLMPLAQYIPMACLAGVLVIVSYNMSGWRTFKALLKNPKSDVTVLLITFFLTVIFDLTIAIEVGLVIACVLFMRRVMETTEISVIKDEIDPNAESDIASNDEHLIIPEDVEVYEINGPYFFGIATKFEEIMARLGDRPKVRIIRMRKVPFIDSTGIHNLTSLCEMSQKEKITIVLSGVNEKVHKVLEKSGFYELLGEENICPNINVALERAKMIIQH